MRLIFPAILVLLAAPVFAETPSAVLSLENGFLLARSAAVAQPLRTSAEIAKCWSRGWDERIDFTGMPLTVCVDRVELELPRDSAGGFYIEGAGVAVGPGSAKSARVTALGRASHPGNVKEKGTVAFSAPLAREAIVFGRKTATGYRVWAHVYVTDTRIGEDALVILNFILDHEGKVVPGSASLEAYTTCPYERCYDRYDETKVEFAD